MEHERAGNMIQFSLKLDIHTSQLQDGGGGWGGNVSSAEFLPKHTLRDILIFHRLPKLR